VLVEVNVDDLCHLSQPRELGLEVRVVERPGPTIQGTIAGLSCIAGSSTSNHNDVPSKLTRIARLPAAADDQANRFGSVHQGDEARPTGRASLYCAATSL
jgi:hypothetical protein